MINPVFAIFVDAKHLMAQLVFSSRRSGPKSLQLGYPKTSGEGILRKKQRLVRIKVTRALPELRKLKLLGEVVEFTFIYTQ